MLLVLSHQPALAGLFGPLGWPAEAGEMTQPGPCPLAAEIPGHSFSSKPGYKLPILHKHLLCVRPEPQATTPHFTFSVCKFRKAQVGFGEDT